MIHLIRFFPPFHFYFSVALFHDRRSKVDRLATLLCSENFAHYLFVNKGKRLLSKCIPTFNPVIIISFSLLFDSPDSIRFEDIHN